MRIRTQFIITMVLFGIALVGISVSAVATNRQVGEASEQETVANGIAQGASELSYLSNDYLIYRESQQLERWRSRFASFSDQVAALHVDEPEQQVLVRNIQANQRRMGEVFDSIASGSASSSPNSGGTDDRAFLEVSWSRMAVQSQGLVSDASRLAQLLRDEVDAARRTNMIVILAMIAVFGSYFLVNYLIVQRRLLESIVALKRGASVVGSGDLSLWIEERGNDEIGELSRAFNQMTANLRSVTASKAELEREIAERRKVEKDKERLLEELRVKNEELQTQSEEIQATNEELMAANDELARATKVAEEAVTARDEFLSVAAHELKTPVTSLLGFAQILLRQYEKQGAMEPERLNRALQVIDRQSSKLTKLVSQLLDISRLEGGRLVLERQRTDLVHLIEEVAAGARLNLAAHELSVETPERAEAFVDPTRIEQVIINLVDNAIRYSPEGGRLEIKVTARDKEVEIAVRDQGIGIPPEHRPHVFDRFYRAHQGRGIAGLGLGLYISKEIVRLHGGRIEIEAPAGGGTRFVVSLPIGRAGSDCLDA